MVHKVRFGLGQQSLFPFFKIGKEGEEVAERSIPCVVYAPKYDEKLREEYDVEITDEGKFRVTTTRIGQRSVIDFVGEFDSYDEAREVMFGKFNQDFNRPSEYSIKFAGRSPAERVWDYTDKGRQVKSSISMTEGTKSIQVVEVRPRVVTVKIRKAPPFILTVRDIHPRYFEKVRERHEVRLTRLRRMGRKSFRSK